MLTNEQRKALELVLEKERKRLERAERNVEDAKANIKSLIAAIDAK